MGSNLEALGGGLLKALRSAAKSKQTGARNFIRTKGFDLVVLLIVTSVSGRQQGPLAELLGHPEQTSAEVHRRQGVLGEVGGQAQQARRLTQTLEVFGILGEPRAEHGAHGPVVVRVENIDIRPLLLLRGFSPHRTPTSEHRSPMVTAHLLLILRLELINNGACSARISFFAGGFADSRTWKSFLFHMSKIHSSSKLLAVKRQAAADWN